MGITVTWDDPVCGGPTTFAMQGSGGSGTYEYYISSINVETQGGWNWVVDPSRILGYHASNQRAFTFYASGLYELTFHVMDKGTLPAKTTRVKAKIRISDSDYPSVDEIAASVVEQCEAAGCKTDFEKALWLHDWVIDNCSYDGKVMNGANITIDNPFVYCGIEGALSPRGLGTCESYYSGYALLLKKAGIENKRVTGNGHVWNAVKMDGEWYQVDPTWDDPGYVDSEVDLRHLYFGLNDSIMALAHSDHKPNAGAESVSLENNYFIKTGEVSRWSDTLADDIRRNLDAGLSAFTLRPTQGWATGAYKDILNGLVAYDLSRRVWTYNDGAASAKIEASCQKGEYVVSVASYTTSDGVEHRIAKEEPTVTTAFSYDGSTKVGVSPSKLGHYVISGTGQAAAAGTYTAKVELAPGYVWDMSGSRTSRSYQWTISKVALSSSVISVSGVSGSYAFTGSAIQPAVVVKHNGRTLKKGVDYDVSYANNVYLGKASMTITGRGGYSGQRSLGYDIVSNSVLVGPKNTWKTVNGKTYYYGSDCRAVKWLQKIGGYWYYFNGASQMQTGWVTWSNDGTKSYFDANGRARTGWQTIGGKRYYFNPSNGRSLRWGQKIGGSWYYFNGASQMQTGWVTWNNDKSKSYFNADGKARTGFQMIGGKTYYFSPSTGRSLRWSQKIGGYWYYFNGNSQMQTGWVTWSNDKSKSYFDSNGRARTGFQKIGGKTYYFSPSTGKSLRWSQKIGGYWYYFNGNSQMQAGWVTWSADKSKSYFDSNGRARTGFQKIGGKTYYFNPSNGKSLRWGQKIGGSFYYFNGASQMHTGWLTWSNGKTKSYFDANGKARTGWQTIGGQRYYFDPVTYKTTGAVSQSITGSTRTVYVTSTGEKYHANGCRYLSQSKIAIQQKNAISQGYGPCSVCKP
ncbi:transglutaminase domain-containing protein [Adlercreutzia sp. R25]|uniref:transglutaminase domain-containing protein n=1 Tax=Adlercreutzia shanghongiae TaxID=3111773 RepID=UPI002DB7BB5B|nr:transglutaminase domain-containing protein [Adlercreutzia sp. R25]MEC4273283.1 transglutaminase domain-containing protein [Adlercreutzia sp. R25]